MKKTLLFIFSCLLFTISNAQLPDLNGYWEGEYTSYLDVSGNFNLAFYQDGNNVYGISVGTDDNYVFEGTISQDTLRGEVFCPDDILLNVKVYESNDSVLFTY